MSNNVMTLLEAALENPSLQKQLQVASTPDRFVNIAAQNGYTLNPDELAQTLGQFHAVFGQVVESIFDSPVPTDLANNLEVGATIPPNPGTNSDLVKRLFSRGEAFDSAGFITFFTDSPLYQFGNLEVCLDKQSIKRSADNFFSQIDAVYHDIKTIKEVGDVVLVEMDVTYWRKDGSMVSLPCCDIFRVQGDKFSELRIFMDVNPVFDSSIPVPNSASVFTAKGAKRQTSPEIMKKHYAEHSEAKQRIEAGFAPKWFTKGKDFSQLSTTSVARIDLVTKMKTAAVRGDWEEFKQFLVEDVYFKIGVSQEMRGARNAIDYLTWFYEIARPNLPFEYRGAWEIEDTVIIQMDLSCFRTHDGKPISFPCTEILRLEGNKIREWRVYIDQSELWMNETGKLHGPRTFH